MSKNTGGPAFPESGLSGMPNGEFIYGRAGMAMRDYFAANLPSDDDEDDFGIEIKVALVGRHCPLWSVDALGCLAWIAEWRAKWRYMRADAMLAERDK